MVTHSGTSAGFVPALLKPLLTLLATLVTLLLAISTRRLRRLHCRHARTLFRLPYLRLRLDSSLRLRLYRSRRLHACRLPFLAPLYALLDTALLPLQLRPRLD